MQERVPAQDEFQIKPLSDEQVEKMDEFMRNADALRERILKRRKGKLFPSSSLLIRQARQERSKRL